MNKFKANTTDDFYKKFIVDDNGCWIWQDTLDKDGYGTFRIRYKRWRAHRFSYWLKYGTLDPKKQLDHLCRKPACVNPEHLEEVTCRVNLMRGNTYASRAAAKTHCKNNHPFTIENTHVAKNGTRKCKECGRVKALRRYYQKKQQITSCTSM